MLKFKSLSFFKKFFFSNKSTNHISLSIRNILTCSSEKRLYAVQKLIEEYKLVDTPPSNEKLTNLFLENMRKVMKHPEKEIKLLIGLFFYFNKLNLGQFTNAFILSINNMKREGILGGPEWKETKEIAIENLENVQLESIDKYCFVFELKSEKNFDVIYEKYLEENINSLRFLFNSSKEFEKQLYEERKKVLEILKHISNNKKLLIVLVNKLIDIDMVDMAKKIIKESGFSISEFPTLDYAFRIKFIGFKLKSDDLYPAFCELEDYFIDSKKLLCLLCKQLLKKSLNGYAISIFRRHHLKQFIDFFSNSDLEVLLKNNEETIYNPLLDNNKFTSLPNIFVSENNEQYIDLTTDYQITERNVHFIDSKMDLDKVTNQILESKILALDCEAIDRKVSILQIANENKKIFIIDMLELKPNQIDNLLLNILQNDSIIKIGQDFQNDLKGLVKNRIKGNLSVNNLFDLQTNFQKLYPKEVKSSLVYLAELFLKKQLSKKEQISNWGKRPLRKWQLHYAALDSYVMIEIYEKMIKLIKP